MSSKLLCFWILKLMIVFIYPQNCTYAKKKELSLTVNLTLPLKKQQLGLLCVSSSPTPKLFNKVYCVFKRRRTGLKISFFSSHSKTSFNWKRFDGKNVNHKPSDTIDILWNTGSIYINILSWLQIIYCCFPFSCSVLSSFHVLIRSIWKVKLYALTLLIEPFLMEELSLSIMLAA